MAEILKPTAARLATILAEHKKWLAGEAGGVRADLRNADLYGADLSGADLRNADLRNADLRNADLYGADLSGADLSNANLSNANLYGANLRNANLRYANLYGADLYGAKIEPLCLARTEILPREGELIVWKKCSAGVLVKLRIPPGARRSNAPGGRKCRAEVAEVLEVVGPDGSPREYAISLHDGTTRYVPGQTVKPSGWGEDRFAECAPGIHFYLTREEAEAHQ